MKMNTQPSSNTVQLIISNSPLNQPMRQHPHREWLALTFSTRISAAPFKIATMNLSPVSTRHPIRHPVHTANHNRLRQIRLALVWLLFRTQNSVHLHLGRVRPASSPAMILSSEFPPQTQLIEKPKQLIHVCFAKFNCLIARVFFDLCFLGQKNLPTFVWNTLQYLCSQDTVCVLI